MKLAMHPAYEQLVAKARAGHERGRSAEGITDDDVTRARLYCYALRMHTIGAYHATRAAIEAQPEPAEPASIHRRHAVEALRDLADMGMDSVPDDFRVVVSTLHRYDTLVHRVLESLRKDYALSRDDRIGEIGERFVEIISEIASGNGLHLTRDTEAPEQGSFVVPNLGITIVPLVYGDHHSWNLAYLAGASGEARDVPVHRHHHGVEIHLGYEPIQGVTILGDCGAEVTEGYAMPIPPMTDHGFVNTTDVPHHVPFIFGSLKQAGWGVFLDVEARECAVDKLRRVPVEDDAMNGTVHLVRELAAAAGGSGSQRRTLIPASRMDRNGSGGLELSVTRVDDGGYAFDPSEHFRIVSVVQGDGVVSVEGLRRDIQALHHFGVPAGMTTAVTTRSDCMLMLDAVIRRA